MAMTRPWLHLCLCLQIPGFCTNLLLPETPERILAKTNSKVEIPCELKVEHVGVYWFRWSQETQDFEFLMFSNQIGKPTYSAGIREDKFSVLAGSSHKTYSLHISHLHPSDNGTYYCSIAQSSQLFLGRGTQLRVVDVFPVPPTTTQAPLPKKPKRCVTKRKDADKTGACSLLVWVPLATIILVLLMCLVPAAYRFHRLRRRLWLRTHRQ